MYNSLLKKIGSTTQKNVSIPYRQCITKEKYPDTAEIVNVFQSLIGKVQRIGITKTTNY